MNILENIKKLKERIKDLCERINRDSKEIVIVAVSKNRTPSEIKEAILAGISDIGENRVQEAMQKYALIKEEFPSVRWHMVGHLQTNKVKIAVKIFDLIQSVDSLYLAEEIDRQAKKVNKIQDILLEVKTSPEPTKFGFKPEDLISAMKNLFQFKNLSIKGLMTIAPLVGNPEDTRPYFRRLRELKEELSSLNYNLNILSMGMTDDFEIAIQEGANMIRIGRAIFGG